MADDKRAGILTGMWLFLYSEIILFGCLFVLYAVYFSKYTQDFITGSSQLDLIMGLINTIILLISSCTVACSLTALRKSQTKLCLFLLGFSFFCGIIFLVNKYFEWGHKIHNNIYPNSSYLQESSDGINIFFGMYYTITGLHGIHVIIGMILLAISFILILRKKLSAKKYFLLENSGLYWHLVDLIWIFVFPLFYLLFS